DLAATAQTTGGFSPAELAGLCNKAALIAIRAYLATHTGPAGNYKDFTITRKHLDEARALLDAQRAPGAAR
ncbi:MAG: hypothetical protein NTV86_17215, partial [Planctomycetota bacterium]|nr:hypothetical protein [Planctomycetota bacterium]